MDGTAKNNSPLTLAINDRLEINAVWLMKLRWVAVVGQLITILFVTYAIGIPVRVAPLMLSLSITAISNLGFTLWLRSNAEVPKFPQTPWYWNRVFVALMALDLAVLTAQLYFTGGHANPFTVFYFVNLALSGILLTAKWAWLLNLLSVVSFAVLLYVQVPLTELRQPENLLSVREIGFTTLSQQGLLVAFATCSSVIVYFATRLTSELKRRDQALRQTQVRQARSEKWESLGTLAAGAAHELATPLTTIAVVSREIERELESQNSPQLLIDDVQVIRQELDRCRGILNQMSTDAGHMTAEEPTEMDIGSLMKHVLDGLSRENRRVNINVPEDLAQLSVMLPVESVGMAVRGIIHNAIDASQDEPVEVKLSKNASMICICVCDQGVGMSEEVLRRADEPFFSTKETGSGMGLGRFLARSVIERLGGSIVTESTPGVGTEVAIQLPLNQSPKPSDDR